MAIAKIGKKEILYYLGYDKKLLELIMLCPSKYI